jgi:hypothetical protein
MLPGGPLLVAWIVQALLAPAPVQPSDLTVRLDLVGRMPTKTNPASPVVAGSQLLLIDQAGYVYRFDTTGPHELLSRRTAPAGMKLTEGEAMLSVAADATGASVYVMFTSTAVPAGIPKRTSPRPGADAWQVLYHYDFDGARLTNPRAVAALEVRSDGHTGGGLAVLDDGTVLATTGDNGDAGEDGRSYPPDPANHLSKIVRINAASGEITIVATGVRNVQRLAVYRNGPPESAAGEPRLDFIDIGGLVSEELNSIRLSELLDGRAARNFGWGRNATDGKAREGTFYIDTAGHVVGAAPKPEPGFVPPVAEFGREGETLVAGSGPVSSRQSFSRITSLFGDLVSGLVYAVTGALSVTGQGVLRVNLVDAASKPVTLKALAGGERPDPRFFNFPDGSAGVLLERTGDFYRLTEVVR